MHESNKRARFERTFFQFTRLEEHFFSLLQNMLMALAERAGEKVQVIVHRRRANTPYLEMSATLNGQNQMVLLQVYGMRPVRYHIQTANTAVGRKLRRYFSLALGEENLNLTSSVQTGPNLSLIYHVHYPEEVLKRLNT